MDHQLTELKGIGEKTAEAFARLGIFTMEDLLTLYPRAYETFEAPQALYALVPGKKAAVQGVLQQDASLNRWNGMTIVNAYLSDMTGRLQLSWYNTPYLRQTLKAGAGYVFRGSVAEKNGRLLMIQPKLYRPEDYEKGYVGRMMPIYPLTKGLRNQVVMKAAAEALKAAQKVHAAAAKQSGTNAGKEETSVQSDANCAKGSPCNDLLADFLPASLRQTYHICSREEALIGIHFPKNEEQLAAARHRLCFDDFFFFLMLAKQLRAKSSAALSAFRCRPDVRLIRLIANLPFELTEAQNRAWKEIFHDLASGKVMNRLVEGDVGSGKTIVAVLALAQAAFNGYQAALMAPTEVLARQHYETMTKLFEQTGTELRVLLVTGSMSQKQKREAYERIAAHEADIIIGTQALFQDAVTYDRLGLVVTDEQHRFGVGQREALRKKSAFPHILVMSATPIPRTLAMILYGDLDVSLIDKPPAGRLPIKNCVVGTNERAKSYRFLLSEIKKGRQCYIICPAVEQSEQTEGDEEAAAGMQSGTQAGTQAGRYDAGGMSEPLQNVTDYAKHLKELMPQEIRIGVLHGKMKASDKDAVMQQFKQGEIDILVATTVVEVGVDVPNASVMMVENAERFGLAQLHQLRGRVGRGTEQSYCILINASKSEKAKERLEILNHSNDGFYIASEDLKMRGPGELLGERQSGELQFQFADIYRDASVLKEAKAAADAIGEEDPSLEKPENRALSAKLVDCLERGHVFD